MKNMIYHASLRILDFVHKRAPSQKVLIGNKNLASFGTSLFLTWNIILAFAREEDG